MRSYFTQGVPDSRSSEVCVGIVPSNYYCMLETLTFYIDIVFSISLCMCHEMIIIILKYHGRLFVYV